MNVLILDDYENMLVVMKESIMHHNSSASCFLAKDYTSAVSHCQSHIMDYAFIDVDLCNSQNGIDFAKWLYSHQPNCKLYIHTNKIIGEDVYEDLKNIQYEVFSEKSFTMDAIKNIVAEKKRATGDTEKVGLIKDEIHIMQLRCVEHHTSIKDMKSDIKDIRDNIDEIFKKIDSILTDKIPSLVTVLYTRSNIATRFSIIIGSAIGVLQVISIILNNKN